MILNAAWREHIDCRVGKLLAMTGKKGKRDNEL